MENDMQLNDKVQDVLFERFGQTKLWPKERDGVGISGEEGENGDWMDLDGKAVADAIREISAQLHEHFTWMAGNGYFWDGGDDIDYTQAAGELMSNLCTALSNGPDDEYGTIALLNYLADPTASKPDWDTVEAARTASNGGYHSATLDAIMELRGDDEDD